MQEALAFLSSKSVPGEDDDYIPVQQAKKNEDTKVRRNRKHEVSERLKEFAFLRLLV